jgi:hypothetical protein
MRGRQCERNRSKGKRREIIAKGILGSRAIYTLGKR